MHHTQIKSFLIAQTRVNWPEVAKWLEFIGVKEPLVVLQQLGLTKEDTATGFTWHHDHNVSTRASALIALCGKRCYNSFEPDLNPNVKKIREDHAEYITNVIASGHGSVFEHATWTFAIENISRVFTGEMNRHRAGVAVSEGSMRYIRFDDIGFTMPKSLETTDVENNAAICAFAPHILTDEAKNHGLTPEQSEDAYRRYMTRAKLDKAFKGAEEIYIDLCNLWKIEEMKDFAQKKKLTSMFRRIIGMGVATGGVWTINARAMRHILQMRANKEHAEEEIFDVFDVIADQMVKDEPLLFGDFTKNEKGSWVPKYPKI